MPTITYRSPGPVKRAACAWLRLRGVDPNLVSKLDLDADLAIVDRYRLNQEGRKFIDLVTHDVAYVEPLILGISYGEIVAICG